MDQAIVELVQIGIFFSKNSDELFAWRNLEPASKLEWLEHNGFNPKPITALEQQDLIESNDPDLLLLLRKLLVENTIDSILQGNSTQAVHDYISQYGVSGGSQTSVQSSGPMLMNSRFHHAKFQAKELLEISKSAEFLSSRYDINTQDAVSRFSAIRLSKNERSIATKEINAVATKKLDAIFIEQRKEFISNAKQSVRKQYTKGVNDYHIQTYSSARNNENIEIILPHNGEVTLGIGKDHFNLYWETTKVRRTGNINLELIGGKLTIVEVSNGTTKTLKYSNGEGSFTVANKTNSFAGNTTYFTRKMAINQFKSNADVLKLNNAYLNQRAQRIDKDKENFVQNSLSVVRKINLTRKRLQRDYNFIDKQFGSIATIEQIEKRGRRQLWRLSLDAKWYVSFINQLDETGKIYTYSNGLRECHNVKAPTISNFKEEYIQGKNVLDDKQSALQKGGIPLIDCYIAHFDHENDRKQGYQIQAAYTINNDYYYTQKMAYMASKETYQNAIQSGDTERQARNLATIRYFDWLAKEDLFNLAEDFYWSTDNKQGSHKKPDFVLPLNVERQRRAAEKVIFLDRHPFAWRARLSFDIWRASMINNLLTKEDNYANANDLGFMPWKRTKRCLGNATTHVWHQLGHAWADAMKPAVWGYNKVSGLWGGDLGTKYLHGSATLFHITGSVGHLIGHGLLNLPNRLTKDTRILSTQIINGIMHPFNEKGHMDALLRDTRGIRHMGKELSELAIYAGNEARWMWLHPKKVFSGNVDWSHAAFHKHLHKQLKVIEFTFSLLGIMPYRKALMSAVKIDIMKRTLKTKIHKQTGLLHPNKKLFGIPFVAQVTYEVNQKVSNLTTKQKLKEVHKIRQHTKAGDLKAAVNAAVTPYLASWHEKALTIKSKSIVWVNTHINAKTLKKWTKDQLTKDYRESIEILRLDHYANANKRQSRIAERDAFFVYKYKPYSRLEKNTILKQFNTYKGNLKSNISSDWSNAGGKKEFQGFKNYILESIKGNSSEFQTKVSNKIAKHTYGYNMFTDILLAYMVSPLVLRLASSKAFVEFAPLMNKSTRKALIDYRKYLIRTQKLKTGTLASEKNSLIFVRKNYRNISRLRRIGSLEIDSSTVNYLSKEWKNETLLNPVASFYAQTFSPSAKQVEAYKKWIKYNRSHRGLKRAFDYGSAKSSHDLYYTTTQLQVEYQNWNGDPITVGELVKTLFSPTSTWDPILLPKPKIHKNASGSDSNPSNGTSTSGSSTSGTGTSGDSTNNADNSVQLMQYYSQLKFAKHLYAKLFNKKGVDKKAKSIKEDSANISEKDKEILEDNISSVETLSEDLGVIDKSAESEINAVVDQEFKDIMLQSLDTILEKVAQNASNDFAREVSKIDTAIEDEIDTDEAVADDLIEVALV